MHRLFLVIEVGKDDVLRLRSSEEDWRMAEDMAGHFEHALVVEASAFTNVPEEFVGEEEEGGGDG